MAFTVRFSDGLTTSYLDDWTFTFEDNGILVISDVANRFHYSSHAWTCVQQDVDPHPRGSWMRPPDGQAPGRTPT